MTTTTTADTSTRLMELCELLHVSVHRPRLTRRIPQSRVVVGNGNNGVGDITLTTEQATNPAWRLMPQEMASALDRIEAQVRTSLARFSVSFRSRTADNLLDGEAKYHIQGLYLVPASHIETLLSQLAMLREEMREVIREWCSDPRRFHDAVRTKLGDVAYEQARAQIPDLSQLVNNADIQAVPIPFGANAEMLREAGERSLLAQARARTREMVDQIAQNLVDAPRRELAETLQNLHDLINKNGRCTVKSLEPVRRAFEKLEMFDFVNDATLRESLASLRTRLDGLTPSEQNATVSAENGLLAALQQVRSDALNEAHIAEQTAKVMSVPAPSRRLRVAARPH